jgi:Fe-S-cluster-containing dehydrogenase component
MSEQDNRPTERHPSCVLHEVSRRSFLRAAGRAAGIVTIVAWGGTSSSVRFVILENADGMLVADSTRCVGCRRCELACTEYNDNRAQPSLSRIKVARNFNFGPKGQQAGFGRGMGQFGDFRVVQDTCKQCPHPVPCETACPNDAIVLDERTRARIIDPERCDGCRFCMRACPWEMVSFDAETGKATKCFLCDGKPVCVEACPAMALKYVPWRDLTRAVPFRQAVLPVTDASRSAACQGCHPGRR